MITKCDEKWQDATCIAEEEISQCSQFSELRHCIDCRLRHRQHVEECVAALLGYEDVRDQLELAAEELRYAAKALGRITGSIGTDDILSTVFSEFCIGK